MLGRLTNIPTGTLIDMLYVILASGVVLTANDVAELEQIQRELQQRADDNRWIVGSTNSSCGFDGGPHSQHVPNGRDTYAGAMLTSTELTALRLAVGSGLKTRGELRTRKAVNNPSSRERNGKCGTEHR
jgi:hypothetical protein